MNDTFPVLGDKLPAGCPRFVKLTALNEDWAKKIHDQTLERLAERGGLSPIELMVNIQKLPFQDIYRVTEDAACEYIKQYAVDPKTFQDPKPQDSKG